MKNEAIRSFSTRISQASKSELTVILYDMTLNELSEAKDAYEAEDLTTYEKNLKRAQKYVSELMATLDYRYSISYDLMSLYMYVSKRIITAIMKRDPQPLDSANSVLNKLIIGFEGVSSVDNSGPVMRNSQQVYAGLTYGKSNLNETYIDASYSSRGFIA